MPVQRSPFLAQKREWYIIVRVLLPLGHIWGIIPPPPYQPQENPSKDSVNWQTPLEFLQIDSVPSILNMKSGGPMFNYHSALHTHRFDAVQFNASLSETSGDKFHYRGAVARVLPPQVDVRQKGRTRQQTLSVDRKESDASSNYRSARQNLHVAYPL